MSYVRNNGMKILMAIWTIAMVASVGTVKAEEMEGGGNKGEVFAIDLFPTLVLYWNSRRPVRRSARAG